MVYSSQKFAELGEKGRAEAWQKAKNGEVELSFGQIIWAQRESLNLSQSGVAQRLDISDALLEKWESDQQLETKTLFHDNKLREILSFNRGKMGQMFLEAAAKLPLPTILAEEKHLSEEQKIRATALANAVEDEGELTVGQFIQARREQLNLSRAQLAQLMRVTKETIKNWETGSTFNLDNKPRIATLKKTLRCEEDKKYSALFDQLMNPITEKTAEEKLRAESLENALKGEGELTAAQFICARREQLNLSRAYLAECFLLSENMIDQWENGNSASYLQELRKAKLKKVLHCEEDEKYAALFDRVMVKPPKQKTEEEQARAAALAEALKGKRTLPIGEFIRAQREHLEMNQERLADAIGVYTAQISYWERDNYLNRLFKDLKTLKQLRVALQCQEGDAAALFDRVMVKPPKKRSEEEQERADALEKALKENASITHGTFIRARRENLEMTIEDIANKVGISQLVLSNWEGDKSGTVTQHEYQAALKAALECEEGEYATLFDRVMQQPVQVRRLTIERPVVPPPAPLPRPDKDGPYGYVLATDRRGRPVVVPAPAPPMLSRDFVEAALDGIIRLSPEQFLSYRRTSLQSAKSWTKIKDESGITREVFESYVDGSVPIPSAQYAALKTALNCNQEKFSDYFDSLFPPMGTQTVERYQRLEGVEYVPATEKMLQAFVRGEKDVWNEELQALIAEKPNVRLDWRGVNMAATKADYSGFDFSQCDLRGMSWPKASLDPDKQLTKDLKLQDAVIANPGKSPTNTNLPIPLSIQEQHRQSNRKTDLPPF